MSNIPLTNGAFHYMSKHRTKSAAEAIAKKLGKKKTQYKIVSKQLPANRSFWEELFGVKAKTNTFYILYAK
jgi:hypothetical protein